MLGSKGRMRGSIVNKNKLIYLPLLIGVVAILFVSGTSYHIGKNLLLNQMKQDGMNLAELATKKIDTYNVALESINSSIEEKIQIAQRTIIDNQHNLSNELLKRVADYVGIDEINWYNTGGLLVYSNREAHVGWVPNEGHPVEDFRMSGDPEWMEEIRKDTVSDHYYKYGYRRSEDGSFVQVGIRADKIEEFTRKFSYQELVESLVKDESIAYALIVDRDFKAIADSDVEDLGIVYADDLQYQQVIQGNVTVSEWYYDNVGHNVLEVAVPIFIDGEIVGILGIGLFMENVHTSIYLLSLSFLIITTVMMLLFLWTQRRNVIRPVRELDENICQIDIENNVSYRLPTPKRDTFFGLYASINLILEKIQQYFYQLKEQEEMLNASHKEISNAHEQLSASEEELKAQHLEMESYIEKLEQLQHKYNVAIHGTGSVIWEIDTREEKIYFAEGIDRVFEKMSGKKLDLHQTIDQMIVEEDREKFIQEYAQYIAGEIDEIHIHVRVQDGQGSMKWLLVCGRGVYDHEGNLISINGISLDVTKLKKQEEYIEHIAYHDSITNLPNRRMFLEKLEEELRHNRIGAVMLLDLDNFKEINDTLGHLFGDKVLKRVAEILVEIGGEHSFISRFGGDEFLILIPEENVGKIENYAREIIDFFKNRITIEEHKIHISLSAGISLYPYDSNDVSQLIMNADLAMYNVKGLGKNNYRLFGRPMLEKLTEKIHLENVLREALKQKGFKVVYQPQICTYTGRIAGFEALLRLRDVNVSPAKFIPVAEETGMIIEMGRWITEEVIHQIRTWKSKGLKEKSVAINFSAKQLADVGYISFLEGKLKENGLDGSCIEIEITENVFLESKENTINFLKGLRDIGVKIALDDFGTGYSSLSYLTFLPVDKIKLDKSLTDKYLETDNVKVIDGIISLTHNLNLEVVAEGVETVEQYKQLKVGACNYIQGYLFSKPLDTEDVEMVYYDDFLEKI